jgi:hypothetical protein
MMNFGGDSAKRHARRVRHFGDAGRGRLLHNASRLQKLLSTHRYFHLRTRLSDSARLELVTPDLQRGHRSIGSDDIPRHNQLQSNAAVEWDGPID